MPPRACITSDEGELNQAFDLRRDVFCGEQGVSEEAEFDGLDDEATHIVALSGGRVVCTCRLLFEGEICRLGRMASAAEHRRGGAGREVIAVAVEAAREAGCERIVIHAQRRAQAFYEACGFEPYGDTFDEEGIPHVMMRHPPLVADAAP